LESEYKNIKAEIKYKCSCGNDEYTTWYNFKKKKNKMCTKCSVNVISSKKKLSLSEIRQFFQKHNCELLEDEYVNARTNMKYMCHCGTLSYIRFDNFKQGQRCMECKKKKLSEDRMYNIDKIHDILSCKNLELLSDYYGYNKEIEFKCLDCKSIESKALIHISRDKQPCRKCYIDSLKGSTSPAWNPNITDEERIQKRHYYEYSQWTKSVYERDDYVCRCCGQIGGKLNAHHIYNYSQNKDLRTDLSNGVVLCEICHREFHNIYGYQDNDEYQLKEYISEIHSVMFNAT